MKTREFVKAAENLKIDQEKRYQRKVKRIQEEKQTTLRDFKKPKGWSLKKGRQVELICKLTPTQHENEHPKRGPHATRIAG